MTLHIGIRDLKLAYLAAATGSLLYAAGIHWHEWLFWAAVIPFWIIYLILDALDKHSHKEEG